jgi:undecaprenyl-diphosphatase
MITLAELRSLARALRAKAQEVAPVWVLLLAPALILGFAKLAVDVEEGETTAFDRYVLLLFRHPGDLSTPIGPVWLQEGARDVTSFGSVAMLGFIFFATVGYLLLARKRAAALFMLVAVGGGQLLSTGLKIAFERPRPEIVPHAVHVFTASFPSGHAMLSAVTYLTLGTLLTRLLPERRIQIYILALAVFLTFMVGLSRVYLGVHYPTDVVAGWLVGAGWAIMCWIIALWLQQRGQIEEPAPRA